MNIQQEFEERFEVSLKGVYYNDIDLTAPVALARIANALEDIAKALEPKPVTLPPVI